MTDLVKRLIDESLLWNSRSPVAHRITSLLLREAAEHIEQLERRLAKLTRLAKETQDEFYSHRVDPHTLEDERVAHDALGESVPENHKPPAPLESKGASRGRQAGQVLVLATGGR